MQYSQKIPIPANNRTKKVPPFAKERRGLHHTLSALFPFHSENPQKEQVRRG